MRDSLQQRAIQIGLGLVGLVIAFGLGILYWFLVPEISLLTLLDRISPYLPLRYEAIVLRGGAL